ncbi:kinesin-domain-containing protein [Trematosphaeria pertusa]|uniref:Kinesin-like protein n=1 Tax=Trematosphaeria pertusa TaxID=390896 RepID=A0A6A6IFT7_9PLEO|nr:kinesin-domain-containing protein [Trematosphaeria pertusa]KAF2248383.1 kinesin-domain-containing protein [Trematosphaeria pertusa]
MDPTTENQGSMKPSGLRPPTKIASKIAMPSSPRSNGLTELTESATNARGAMGPPPTGSIKHKPSGLPEPDAKRKTLRERAGEPYGSVLAAPPSSRPVNNVVKSIAANGSRGFSASTSRVPSNKTSRHISANSFGGSVGPGSRVPSANGYGARPKSAYGHSRSKSHHQGARPATSMAQHEEEDRPEPKVLYDDTRFADLEAKFTEFKEKIEVDISQQSNLKDTIKLYETRNGELEATCAQYRTLIDDHKTELKDLRSLLSTTNMELESTRRSHSFEADDLRRKHRNDLEDLESRYRKDAERSKRENEEAADKVQKEFETQIEKLLKLHSEELADLEKRWRTELEEERSKRLREVQEAQTEFALKMKTAGLEVDTKQREAQLIQGELTNVKAELDRERILKHGLQSQLAEATTHNFTLEAANKAMKEKINFLESDSQAQSQAFNDLHRRMQDAIEAAEVANEKLRQEETLRRKLHNQVQELKGNIRVMCRVRPTHDSETEPAKIAFPDADTDSKEVAVQGPEKQSALGTNTTQTYSYAFDRVFGPLSQNAEVFEEISQLVQSALDGYNVCIFCYGQTGSGKTYTMSSADGMIPLATAQIYAEATRLEEKGWRYKMEGSFVEVYNETYNDLLGRSEDIDKKKVEVRHDPAKKQTTLENAVSVGLDGPHRVEEILKTASKNRSVAATKANMRSSRSHSVFILKLVGENSITGEKSEGTLNLVDLAGSERLEHSKAEGARLKETQNINKSLSCLGDVINALGSAKEGSHIPYRNSKLTYLLQYSLGGNSKTLMFVMVSPLQAHLQETITSLKFATKVHNTHIGTAKKQTRA